MRSVCRLMNTWWPLCTECVKACVALPRPLKYLPHTRHAYTFWSDRLMEHTFSKSKSSSWWLTVSRYGHLRRLAPGASSARSPSSALRFIAAAACPVRSNCELFVWARSLASYP